MGQLIFQDWGAAVLFVAFIALHIASPFKVRGRVLRSGDLNVTFTLVLILYVGARWYFDVL